MKDELIIRLTFQEVEDVLYSLKLNPETQFYELIKKFEIYYELFKKKQKQENEN